MNVRKWIQLKLQVAPDVVFVLNATTSALQAEG